MNIEVGDESKEIILNVRGSGKCLKIDVEKLKEAITVQEGTVEEKSGGIKIEEKKDILSGFNMDTITEEEFLNKAVEVIGEIKKTKNKTL